jgi:hypothetical protein
LQDPCSYEPEIDSVITTKQSQQLKEAITSYCGARLVYRCKHLIHMKMERKHLVREVPVLIPITSARA